ncbi:uncharacterized protein SPPG_00933 [Spizellomyces punctatus DAOM BR117]|uniref:Uncharacterized protein n=1 Tax=Spizellomyces punctatus (strain DAOM BR117) TaxID=645134 RepID=A0A0L0HR81_SPIPD|nr:uncharacterized protein SPPG_00933 [Spizellomyces punctatus DAOM BR117]KND03450.1 hypothetical protein SPPG_00933 [Spizellomyces punctatus DAOM BR117]|eukprot:XP_016611489.1 hypothetical protein SPPG_00933 [Spizellomyces punctatus DAOM BR117]
MWGDLPTLLDAPVFNVETDVFTLSFGDSWRLYTRGQFTAFNQHRPKINDAWRSCKQLKTLDDTIAFFNSTDWAALDEGCGADAVLKSDFTLTEAPIQEADWTHVVLSRSDRGILTNCRSANNSVQIRHKCREAMRKITSELVNSNRTSPFSLPPVESRPLKLYQPEDKREMCSYWLPQDQQWCVANSISEDVAWWVHVANSNGSIGKKYLYSTANSQRDTAAEIQVIESALFHLQNWKHQNLTVLFDPDVDDRALKVGRGVIEVYENRNDGDEESKGIIMRYVNLA